MSTNNQATADITAVAAPSGPIIPNDVADTPSQKSVPSLSENVRGLVLRSLALLYLVLWALPLHATPPAGFDEIVVNTGWSGANSSWEPPALPPGWTSIGRAGTTVPTSPNLGTFQNLVPGKEHYIDVTYKGPGLSRAELILFITGSSPSWNVQLVDLDGVQGPPVLRNFNNNETKRISFVPSSTSASLGCNVGFGGQILVSSIYRPTATATPTQATATAFKLTWVGMRNANTFCIQFDLALNDDTKTRSVRVQTTINGTQIDRVFEKGDNRVFHTGQIDIELAEPEFKRFEDNVVVDLTVTVDQFVRTRRVVIPLPTIFVGGIDPLKSEHVQGGNGTFQLFEDSLNDRFASLYGSEGKYIFNTVTSPGFVAKSYCYLVNVGGNQPGFPTRAGSGSWDVPYYPTMHTLSFFGENIDRNTVGLFQGGDYLKTAIDVMLSRTYAKRVNVIAHSKGCLITRAMLSKKYEEMDEAGRLVSKSYGLKVRNAVMIQGPHYGSMLGEAPLLLRGAWPFFTIYRPDVYKNLYPLWRCFREEKDQGIFYPDPDFDNSELKKLNRYSLPSRSGVKYTLVYGVAPRTRLLPNTPYTQTGRFTTEVVNTPTGPHIVPKLPRFSTGPGDLIVPLFSQKGYKYNANNPHAYNPDDRNPLNGLIPAFVEAAKAKCIVWSRISANHMEGMGSAQTFRAAWDTLWAPVTSRLQYPGEQGDGFLPEEEDDREPLPTAPGSLVVVSTSRTGARLGWKDFSNNETKFVVETRLALGAWETKTTTLANVSTASIESLVPGQSYEVRVSAVNRDGRASPSAVALFATPLGMVAPARLDGVGLSADGARVSWSFSDPYADRLQMMYRIPSRSDWAYLPDLMLTSTNADFQGLPANSTIELRVRAVYKNASGGESASDWSNTITIQTLARASVESASASVQSPTSILVRWVMAPAGQLRFQVMRRDVTGGGGWQYLADPTAADRSVVDSGLLPDREYQYQVRAIYLGEEISNWRETASARTQQQPPAPLTVPDQFRAAPAYAHDVVLGWNYENTDGQFIIEQLSPGGGWFRAMLVDGRSRGVNIGGLQPGSIYQFAIRYLATDGRFSDHSDIIGVQTASAGQIETPSALRANSPGATVVHLEWDYRSEAASFIVEEWSAATGWFRAGTVQGTDKMVNVLGLRPGTQYQFALRAVSPFGDLSDHSNIIGIQTSSGTPGSPNDLHRGEVGLNWFDLVWNDNANDETYFEVWVMPAGGSFQLSENVPADRANARIEYERSGGPRLKPNTLYTVRVYAVNGSGRSAYDEVQIRTRQ